MSRQIFKGIKNVIEGSFSAETGYLYFVRETTDTSKTHGYVFFNGKKYGNVTDIEGLPVVTSSDNLKVLQVRDGEWSVVTPLVVYSGTDAIPPETLGNDGDIYLQSVEMMRKPDVIYQTDGTTGLLGHNANTLDGHWQIEDLNLAPYNFIRCYFAAGTATGDSRTSAVIIDVPLDAGAMGPTGYIGGNLVPLPFNRNRQYFVSCAVDSTKTKFQVIHQNTIWDVTTSDANNNGRYCYKIEGWY